MTKEMFQAQMLLRARLPDLLNKTIRDRQPWSVSYNGGISGGERADVAHAKLLGRADIICWSTNAIHRMLASEVTEEALSAIPMASQIHFMEEAPLVSNDLGITLQGEFPDTRILADFYIFTINTKTDKAHCCVGVVFYMGKWRGWRHIDYRKVFVDAFNYDLDNSEGIPVYAPYFQRNAFLHTPFVDLEPHKVKPAGQSSYKRSGKGCATTVNVVVLRKIAKCEGGGLSISSPDGTKRTLHCQFIVGAAEGGFWRNQWYPSENMHRRIWVDAYQKGPTTAPFKAPTQRVFKAAR